MEDTLMPKAVFFGELCQGKQGSPPEMLQGSVMTTAKCNEEKDWENVAKDKGSCRATTKLGAEGVETARRESAEEKPVGEP